MALSHSGPRLGILTSESLARLHLTSERLAALAPDVAGDALERLREACQALQEAWSSDPSYGPLTATFRMELSEVSARLDRQHQQQVLEAQLPRAARGGRTRL